jgi:hypothetical protein
VENETVIGSSKNHDSRDEQSKQHHERIDPHSIPHTYLIRTQAQASARHPYEGGRLGFI